MRRKILFAAALSGGAVSQFACALDHFVVAGSANLHRVTLDASVDGANDITLQFTPPLRKQADQGTQLLPVGGTTAAAIFAANNPNSQWILDSNTEHTDDTLADPAAFITPTFGVVLFEDVLA